MAQCHCEPMLYALFSAPGIRVKVEIDRAANSPDAGRNFSKTLSVHPAVNGYPVLFRAGKVNGVQKVNDIPPQLHRGRYKFVSNKHFPIRPLAKGQPIPL